MAEKLEIVLSGSGGQGLLTAGQILADAAVRDGRNAVQTQSYGPEARGGACRAEVIISEGEIYYPRVNRPDVLLAMSGEALAKYAGRLNPGGVLLVDTTFIRSVPPTGGRVLALPFSRLAGESLGKVMVANIVALGALAELTRAVSPGSLLSALISRVPPGTVALNRKALELGRRIAHHTAAAVNI